MTDIISCRQARATGLSTYFTGKACPQQHICARYVSDYSCVECRAENGKTCVRPPKEIATAKRRAWVENNREKSRAAKRAYYANTSDKQKKTQKKIREKKKEQYKSARSARHNANPEIRREIDARYYRKNRERILSYLNGYREENKKLISAAGRIYREKNLDKIRARMKEYYQNNKEIYYAAVHRRKARLANCEGSFTYDDVRALLIAQEFKCVYCKADIIKKYTVDHIMPISKGGSNWPSNLQMLCKSCNCKKKDKLPEEFSAEIR
jgi:5-methylcytosine-specific restriction endonuclease McrA